jgi:hypothetical protein
MSTPSRELAELLDREKIRGCLARLARGEDRRNTQLIAGSYWPQAIIDHGIFTGTFDEYWPGSSPARPISRSHSMCSGKASSSFTPTLRWWKPTCWHITGFPPKAGIATPSSAAAIWTGWTRSISRRTMVYDWMQNLGASVDWTTGLMGMPFDTARYAGRAAADYSEEFFGDRSKTATQDTTE